MNSVYLISSKYPHPLFLYYFHRSKATILRMKILFMTNKEEF